MENYFSDMNVEQLEERKATLIDELRAETQEQETEERTALTEEEIGEFEEILSDGEVPF